MKKVLVTIALLGFGFSANADRGMELQINGGFAGTAGQVQMNDDDRGDNTPWSLGGEIYKSMNDNVQIGGILGLSDSDTTGSDTNITLGVAGRYNFDADLRNSMFVGAALTYTDAGDADMMNVNIQFGKRYALSDTITYTPNIAYNTTVSGDDGAGNDIEGSTISINLLSFSGFM